MSRKRATTNGVNGQDGAGELPTLPKGWTWAKVHEVGEVKLGRQRSPEHHHGPHMRPYLRVANVYEDRIDLSDVLEMNFTPEEYKTYRLQHGDILLNEGQSLEWVGRPAMYRDELPGSCFQNTLVRFRPGPAVLPAFALLIFRHYLHSQRFQRIAKWTVNIAHLGASRFAELEFPVPPLDEQRRITEKSDELLADLDVGVATLRRVRTTLKRYRASVLKAAVEGRLTEEWRTKHPDVEPGSALLARILTERRRRWEERQLAKFAQVGKQSPKGWREKYVQPSGPDSQELPALPTGWIWASVDQLLTEPTCNGISVKGADTPPGIAALRLSGMSATGFDYSKRRYLPIDDSTGERLAIRQDDFFVSRGNGSLHLVGRGTLAQEPPELIVFPDTMIRLRVCNEGPLRRFLNLIWGSRLLRRQVEKRARTTAGIYKISQRDIESFVVPLPASAEQDEIVKEIEQRCSILDEIESQIESNLKRAAHLRQSILKCAFEGRLVPQDLADEPADRLLERIRQQREAAVEPREGSGRGRRRLPKR